MSCTFLTTWQLEALSFLLVNMLVLPVSCSFSFHPTTLCKRYHNKPFPPPSFTPLPPSQGLKELNMSCTFLTTWQLEVLAKGLIANKTLAKVWGGVGRGEQQ